MNNLLFYNNDKTKFLFKHEIFVSNNVRIMLRQNKNYIVDIFTDDGINNIVNGLLDVCFDNYEIAHQQYNHYLKYLDSSDLYTILVNEKKQILKCA